MIPFRTRHLREKMKIEDKHVVALNYTLTNNDKEVLDQSMDSSFVYLHGYNNIIPGLENALKGKAVSDKFSVKIAPKDAYGEKDESRIETVPKNMFPTDQEIAPGMQFHAQGPNGEAIAITVVEVLEDSVKIDGNHALAGVELTFDVEVMSIREAEQIEIEHGHVHGPGGHHH